MPTDSQGPPLSIFGNKFHSRFLGTGQKVPGLGIKGQVQLSMFLMLPKCGDAPYSWQAGRTRCKAHRGSWCKQPRPHSGWWEVR